MNKLIIATTLSLLPVIASAHPHCQCECKPVPTIVEGNAPITTIPSQKVVVVDKTYFYMKPSKYDRSRTYIVKGDVVTVSGNSNGYSNVFYQSASGKSYSRWVLSSHLGNASDSRD